MKPLVIYHADCTDGFGAAFAAWLRLGNEAEYVAVQYNDFVPKQLDYTADLSEREVYILDFSFPRQRMEHIFANAKHVVWLDHHKSAFEMWCRKYEKGMIYEQRTAMQMHRIILNDNNSGALLAWEYFHPGTEVPMLIQHIDDRDRWQFKLEGSKELHAALASYKPWSFEQWRQWLDSGDRRYWFKTSFLIKEGSAILRAQDAHIKSMLKQARKCYIKVQDVHCEGYDSHFPGLALNTPMHMSEVGHELANQSGTYGLVWYLGNDNRAKCSLRSNGDYNVLAIAKAFGGGGHHNAAGFETDIETLIGWLK